MTFNREKFGARRSELRRPIAAAIARTWCTGPSSAPANVPLMQRLSDHRFADSATVDADRQEFWLKVEPFERPRTVVMISTSLPRAWATLSGSVASFTSTSPSSRRTRPPCAGMRAEAGESTRTSPAASPIGPRARLPEPSRATSRTAPASASSRSSAPPDRSRR